MHTATKMFMEMRTRRGQRFLGSSGGSGWLGLGLGVDRPATSGTGRASTCSGERTMAARRVPRTRPRGGFRARRVREMPVGPAVAAVGGRLFTGLLDLTSDVAALDSDGLWVVVATFEGDVTCARFASVQPAPR